MINIRKYTESFSFSLKIKIISYCYVAIAVFSFFDHLAKKSNLLPSSDFSYDPSVFATIGYSWLHGLIPYKDLFDHKGPLVYLVNALGFFLVGSPTGVALIEIVFFILFFTLIIYLFRDHLFVLGSFLFLCINSLLMKSHEGGGHCEDYSLVFLMIAVYIYFKRPKSHRLFFALMGLLGSIAFLFKANVAMIPFILFLYAAWEERFSFSFCKSIFWCALGFFPLLLLFSFYFMSKGAFNEFLNGLILYNVYYIDIGNTVFDPETYPNSLAVLTKYRHDFSVFFFSLCALLLFLYFRNATAFLKCLFFLIVSYIALTISKRPYLHYLLPLNVVFIYITYITLQDIKTTKAFNVFREKIFTYLHRWCDIDKILILFLVGVSISTFHMSRRFYVSLTSSYYSNLVLDLKELGITPDSKVLNLYMHGSSASFFMTGTYPDQKYFFPKIINPEKGTARDPLINYSSIVKSKKYDFILAPPDLELNKGVTLYEDTNYIFKHAKVYRKIEDKNK